MATPNQQRLFDQCRDIARSRLGEVISVALAKVDEDLFALADKTVERDEQRVYLDAMARIREHRSGLQQRFEDCFGDLYSKKLGTANGKPAGKTAGDFGGIELSLVSHSKIEHGIVIDRLAQGVKKGADGDEMLGIRARFGHMLKRDTLDDADNPLAPELILEALRLACNQIPASNAVKQALLSAFQPYLRASINDVYHAVNEALVAHQVLPQIKHTVRTTADPMGATGRMATLGTSQRMPVLGNTQRMGLLNDDRVEPAQRSGGLGGSFGNEVGHETASLSTLLAGLAQGRAGASGEALGLFSNPERFPAGPGALRASADLMQSLGRLQSSANLGVEAAAGLPGYLHQMGANLQAQGTPLDQLTIELVAMVFDFLFANPHLPEFVKGSISRLQIVAVKAALLDRSFFARREHPMRRLLDRMAEAGTDPMVDVAPESPFRHALAELADDLCVRFTDDVAVFDAAIERVDALVAAEHARHAAASAAAASAVAAEEARAAALAHARADLALRFTATTPEFIRQFLDQWWVHAAVEADLAGTEGEDGVTARLAIATDLAWSVEPKARADVPTLAAILPGMMRGLMRGARCAVMPEEVRQAFFGALMQAHTAAISAAKSAPAETRVMARPTAEEGVRRAILPVIVPSETWERQVDALCKGDVVEFSDSRNVQRFRLGWVSPKKTVYLFLAQGAMRQLAAADLAALFRQGMAVLPAPDMPLVDQALDAMAQAPLRGVAIRQAA